MDKNLKPVTTAAGPFTGGVAPLVYDAIYGIVGALGGATVTHKLHTRKKTKAAASPAPSNKVPVTT